MDCDLRSAALLLAALSCTNAACFRDSRGATREEQAAAVELTAKTAAPELWVGRDTEVLRIDPLSRVFRLDGRRGVSPFYVPMRTVPAGATRSSRAGTDLPIGYRRASWVIVGTPSTELSLFFDSNSTGDLFSERPHALTRHEGPTPSWTTTVYATGRIRDDVTSRAVLGITYTESELRVDAVNIRRGTIPIGGKNVAFAVVGLHGEYGLAPGRTYFDLDGNGELDLGPRSEEWVYNRDGLVTLEGIGYRFRVDPAGENLKISPTPLQPRRPKELLPRHPAPDLGVPDTSGAVVDLSAMLGRRVLVTFWSMSCPPCIAELPELEALRRAAPDVLIIGITPDPISQKLLDLTSKAGIEWRVVSLPFESRVYTDYGVEAFPKHVVVDDDRRLGCIGCSLAELRERLIAH